MVLIVGRLSMDDLIQYLINDKETLIRDEGSLIEKLEKYKLENEQIELKITELIKSVDTTFEVFSPNTIDKDYNVSEIQRLKYQLEHNQAEIKAYEEQQNIIKNRLNSVYDAISTYEKIQGTERTLNFDISQYKIETRDEMERLKRLAIEIAELEEQRYTRFLSVEWNPILESLERKSELCEGFILQDINRSKMEMNGIQEGISTLKHKVENYMFHVKHLQNKEKYFLYQELKDYINHYQNTILDITMMGEDVELSEWDIQNNIKIIHEIIDNAIYHGGARHIQIHLHTETTEFLKNRIQLSIHDDGCGYIVEEVDSKNHYGLEIVKKRIEIYHGNMVIESNHENGTTVFIDYVVS